MSDSPIKYSSEQRKEISYHAPVELGPEVMLSGRDVCFPQLISSDMAPNG